jgi:Uma2 family endonuclease
MPSTARRPRTPVFGVDERLVAPETRFEVVGGKVLYVSPAEEPHATRHSKTNALLEAHVAPGWQVACDMLTRTSALSDMAPDASVYPAARDPLTGRRQLEELAFEIVSTERLAAAGAKARELANRGVRRIFAIDVERRRALEWSRRTGAWEILPADGAIEDRVFVKPLPLAALVGAASADDAMAEALIAKRNRVLVQALDAAEARGKALGKALGKAEALIVMLLTRGLVVRPTDARRIRQTRDEATLDDWLSRAATCSSTADLLGAPRQRRSRRR